MRPGDTQAALFYSLCSSGLVKRAVGAADAWVDTPSWEWMEITNTEGWRRRQHQIAAEVAGITWQP